MSDPGKEPTIDVGLVEKTGPVAMRLLGDFLDPAGRKVPAGDYRVDCRDGELRCSGAVSFESTGLEFTPVDPDTGGFSLEATIGIDFHWQQTEMQTFHGQLRVLTQANDLLTVVNRVPLETYLTSVVCSEMRSTSPPDLAKAHAVVSRSWLLAQLESRNAGLKDSPGPASRDELIRWYDREAHTDFDVCADDHCQRYQGVGRIESPGIAQAVIDTRGQVLTFKGKPCDARFSKCCGGVTEDFRTAWSDRAVPYLVPVFDGPGRKMPALTEDCTLREYISSPPDVYCNCSDDNILNQVLNPYDLETRDFFRWQVRLEAKPLSDLVREKLDVDLGRIVKLEPVLRGLSGRLTRLRLVGEKGSLVIGKELEIRRVLSPTHLYSSAFVIDTEGPPEKPELFILSGAGWGHGVGLCQIGAAAMAFKGIRYHDILRHYYPGTSIDRLYA